MAAIDTAVIAAPVLRAPSEPVFGMEIVGATTTRRLFTEHFPVLDGLRTLEARMLPG